MNENCEHVNELIGCCGLDCEKCDARIATLKNDNTAGDLLSTDRKPFQPPPALATLSANFPMPVDTVPTPLTIFENTRIAGPAAAAIAANLTIMSR